MGTISTEGLESYLIAALISSDSYSSISDLINKNAISRDIFTDWKYKKLFDIINQASFDRQPIDFAVLYSKAKYVPGLDGIVNLLPIPDASPLLIPNYLNEIKDIRKKQLVTDLVGEGPTEDPVEFTERLQSRFNKLIKQDREFESVQEIAKRVFKNIEKASENPGELTGVTSGIKLLDDITWGFQARTFYILAGRPSMGKSAFALNIAINAMQAKKNVYIHSLEESSHGIVSRMVSYFAEIPNENLKKGDVSKYEWEKIVQSIDQISSKNIIINDKMGISSMDICSDIMRSNQKKPVDLVIIDHVQEVYDEAANRHLAVSKAASNFRSLGKSLGVPVILVSQLSRMVEQRKDKRPMLSDLKESGDLEAQADMVIFLYRDDYYSKPLVPTNDVEINIAKNRDGRTGFINIKWTPEYLKFHG